MSIKVLSVLENYQASANYIHQYSPALTGIPTAPTAALGTNNTQLATTAFVMANTGGAGASIRYNGDIANEYGEIVPLIQLFGG